MLAFGVAAGAHAQSSKRDQAVLPVWNQASGKIEAVLLLEPTNGKAGSRLRFGDSTLDAAFGIEAGNSLGVFCDRETGLGSALGNLANNCMLASFGDGESRRASGTAALNAGSNRIGVTAGAGTGTLPGWLSPGNRVASSKIDVNDLTVFAQRNIGREGVVSIAGTMAKATLMTPAEATSLGLSDQWTSRSLSVGGGYGRFGASIVGHVVDTPGQPKWEGLGLGLTWRTPWSGQLTVGADNLVTRGRNPFTPTIDGREDEGTVPYVRYEQDL
ncbi:MULTISPECIES: hypothetical protein [unclassified Luteimonas]|uniref:XOO1806 family protein n=1 Tax=unclassified Luteimonas TaxID=2629088 RepID=UPI0016049B8E|nr:MULTISPECIES: hypothetical protein [unclassified Luteimonas]MBB1472779.1 hypothetical protein [Luteimonas sp. MC1782]MBB6598517.1 hypothetical protein [Luteimonas sp. MC1825]QOC89443.1 hypothetical protein IDM46_02815 [Luteimonas sp. MC1825]